MFKQAIAQILNNLYIYTMAKAVKKKSAKEGSELFHNIMAASVAGNPKPVVKKKTATKK